MRPHSIRQCKTRYRIPWAPSGSDLPMQTAAPTCKNPSTTPFLPRVGFSYLLNPNTISEAALASMRITGVTTPKRRRNGSGLWLKGQR